MIIYDHHSVCQRMPAYAKARDSNWLWLKPGIGMPGGIPGDSSHHPNWLWLLAIARLGSQRIARV